LYYQNNGTVAKFVFQYEHSEHNWHIEHNPNNHIYKRVTVGDIVSSRNPNTEQSRAALQAIDSLSEDAKIEISKWGGNKKSKKRTRKNKKSKKRTRKNKKSKKKKPRKKLI